MVQIPSPPPPRSVPTMASCEPSGDHARLVIGENASVTVRMNVPSASISRTEYSDDSFMWTYAMMGLSGDHRGLEFVRHDHVRPAGRPVRAPGVAREAAHRRPVRDSWCRSHRR